MKAIYGLLCATLVLFWGVAAHAALPAPENFTAEVVGDNVEFDWDDVEDADKYSVDIEITALVDIVVDEQVVDTVEMDASLSYGTSDRTDGGDMADSDLTISLDTLLADLADELGVDVENIQSIDASAMVKALDAGKGKGRQNNPFSDPDDFSWSAN